MDKDKGPLTWLKNQLTNSKQGKRNKYHYLLLVILFGAAIMLIGNLIPSGNQKSTDDIPVIKGEKDIKEELPAFGQKNSKDNEIITAYEKAYENQLKEALEKMIGVEDVTVVVNIDATEKKVLEKNTVTQSQTTDETDQEGGKRKVEDQSKDEQVVIIRNGEKEVPIVLETKKPEIRGVLVVAKGADHIQVKKWIIEAVTRVLDVPSHRVAVMPKKTKEE
ncbi:stage III sporulation protein AG [Bacillus aquiflavi]|uniref:Stage III sporulation protein AG n=1 Tax=Bacillus aquiflavi TaxID=2672567 RepID=A0A6B3VX86_9BACI|nr:stage III sporulation protein AG [Bacillus aquiflavi]MBA4535775.1 stage III sporulation protein AG [Bacillus aquiflavi]NEY80151.1 stage III sporulation protein AG [Bacillus aquiflavi]UAC47207.1 stage III sporulation protein AG [Bacillus aquiflavi]